MANTCTITFCVLFQWCLEQNLAAATEQELMLSPSRRSTNLAICQCLERVFGGKMSVNNPQNSGKATRHKWSAAECKFKSMKTCQKGVFSVVLPTEAFSALTFKSIPQSLMTFSPSFCQPPAQPTWIQTSRTMHFFLKIKNGSKRHEATRNSRLPLTWFGHRRRARQVLAI